MSCEPTLSNADIIFSCLCALYSHFLAMWDYNINITEKYQIIFNDVLKTSRNLKAANCVFSFDAWSEIC